jgi:hypothetical protein
MSDYALSNEEKVTVIITHLRNLSYTKYNTELSIIEEESLSAPSAENLAQLNAQLDTVNTKVAALAAELELVR